MGSGIPDFSTDFSCVTIKIIMGVLAILVNKNPKASFVTAQKIMMALKKFFG